MHNTVSKKDPKESTLIMERTQLAELLAKAEKAEPSELTNQEIVALLGLTDPEDCRMLKDAAFRRTTALMGPYVYYRGLIELSNICTANCRYCGIRKANHDVKRYTMTKEEIVEAAVWAADNGYGSVCLQAGERRDEKFIEVICECLREIHLRTKRPMLPKGVGVTLSLGDQREETYRRWAKACGIRSRSATWRASKLRIRSFSICCTQPPAPTKRISSTVSNVCAVCAVRGTSSARA